MDSLSPLRRRLVSLTSALFLALSIWVIDYVVLPPLWPLFTHTSDLHTRYTAAAQVLRHPQLRIGVALDKLPLGATTADGKFAGFKIDLAHELAKRWFADEMPLAVFPAPEETLGQLAPDYVDLTIVTLAQQPRKSNWAAAGSPYGQWRHIKLPLLHQPLAIGVPHDDSALVALVSHTLLDMQRDGSYERLYSRWFGEQAKSTTEDQQNTEK